MESIGWGWILLLLLTAAAVGGAVYLRDRVRYFAQLLFHRDSFAEGVAARAYEESNTPKSVSAQTTTLLPLIQRDFPEFHWDEYRQKAGNVLKSALLAISAGDVSGLSADANADLRREVSLAIEDDALRGVFRRYGDVTVHRTEIIAYRKTAGTCVVTLQSAVGCTAFAVDGTGALVTGRRDVLTQTKYNLDLVYIQDADKLGDDEKAAFGVNCPNCGAPVTQLGKKSCQYCGAALEVVNIRAWSFGAYREQ